MACCTLALCCAEPMIGALVCLAAGAAAAPCTQQ